MAPISARAPLVALPATIQARCFMRAVYQKRSRFLIAPRLFRFPRRGIGEPTLARRLLSLRKGVGGGVKAAATGERNRTPFLPRALTPSRLRERWFLPRCDIWAHCFTGTSVHLVFLAFLAFVPFCFLVQPLSVSLQDPVPFLLCGC